jgi:DNA-binding LacI/PurR family transcriptional regulator
MVARAAGVSRATVSRVVNGSPKVRPDLIASVSEAVERLHYVPNRAARSLVSRRTGAIALVVPEDVSRFFGDPFFAAIVQGITRRLDTSDYVLNLLVASSDPEHKTVRYLSQGSVDGALVISHHTGDALSTPSRIPVVYGGRPAPEMEDEAYFVDVDNLGGGEAATGRLIDLGRRRIGSITGPPDMTAGIDRLEGFRRAMDAAGLPADAVEAGDFTVVGAVAAMRRLLERETEIDGLFVASDLMAVGAISVLRESGRRIPEDVAVVGFDDSPAAISGEIPLTTVRQPSTEMGFTMADALIRLLAGEADVPRHNILPTSLVVRASA